MSGAHCPKDLVSDSNFGANVVLSFTSIFRLIAIQTMWFSFMKYCSGVLRDHLFCAVTAAHFAL